MEDRAACDGWENAGGFWCDQFIVFCDKDQVGAACFLNFRSSLRIQVNVLVKSLFVSIDNRMKAHGIVQPGFDMTCSMWSSPVKVTDTDGDRFGAALEIWAYRSSKNTELVFTGRLNSDNGVKTKHIGADIKAGT